MFAQSSHFFFFCVRNSRAWIILIYRLWRFAVHQNFLNDFHLDCFLLTKVTVKWSLKHNTTSAKKQLVKQGTTFYQVSWIVWRWRWEIWTKVIMATKDFRLNEGRGNIRSTTLPFLLIVVFISQPSQSLNKGSEIYFKVTRLAAQGS